MRRYVSFQRAVQLSLLLFGLFGLFHLVIIIGILAFEFAPVDYLWGGQMESPEQLLVFELISLIVIALCLTIVSIRSGNLHAPALLKASRVALWLLFVLFVLNTIGNLFAKTTFEQFLSLITALLAVVCLRMALEPIDQSQKR